MANVLKAYYYTHGAADLSGKITVDFMGAIATNTGIAVDSYQMGIPGVETARNNSLYSDTPFPVYSKRSTVTDTLTVTVRGSTNTALYTNLHLLAKLGEYARAASESPLERWPAYLEMKPGGSAAGEVLYAAIYDCRVEMPADWANSQDARLMVEDVTVTIERGIWQNALPPSTGDETLSGATQALAGSKSSTADVGGDTPSLTTVDIQRASHTNQFDRIILGIRSKAQSVQHAALGVNEAEALTNGTDASDAADATARGGNKVECTFATPTNAIRLSGAIAPPGIHRVFARMKITSTAVATVYAAYCDETVAGGGVLVANASVSVSSTSWLVYDLGVINAFRHGYAYASVSNLGTVAIYALLASGTGNLDIDWIFIMPTEHYMTAQGLAIGTSAPSNGFIFFSTTSLTTPFAAVLGSTYLKKISSPAYTMSISLPPGPYTAYWLIGTDSGSVFDVKPTTELTISIRSNSRFLMPSEV